MSVHNPVATKKTWACKALLKSCCLHGSAKISFQVPCQNTEAWACKILVVHSRKKCFLLPWSCLLRDFAQFLGCLRQDFLQSLGCHRHYFSSTAHLCQILVIHLRKRCFFASLDCHRQDFAQSFGCLRQDFAESLVFGTLKVKSRSRFWFS